jgi:hypothetical protein
MRPPQVKWEVNPNPHCFQLEVVGRFMSDDGKVTEISRQVPILHSSYAFEYKTKAAVAKAQASITAEYEFTEKYGWLKSL